MASESIGAIYPTQIPGLADIADIQEAFKLYHYGSSAYDTANTDPAELVNPSIAYTLTDLQDQISGIDTTGKVSLDTINAKGDLLVGLSDNTVDSLSVGSNNYILTADSSETLGLKWAAPSVSADNTVTLTNKTLTSPAVDGFGIIFEGTTADVYETTLSVIDPTADRTIELPDESGTVELKDISIKEVTDATYTFIISDRGKLITANSSSSQTFSIPTDATTNFPIGTQINIVQYGSGQITIQADTPATTTIVSSAAISDAPKTRVQYSSVTCIKTTTNFWLAIGDIE
jgi:hypothetical protein